MASDRWAERVVVFSVVPSCTWEWGEETAARMRKNTKTKTKKGEKEKRESMSDVCVNSGVCGHGMPAQLLPYVIAEEHSLRTQVAELHSLASSAGMCDACCLMFVICAGDVCDP